MVRSSLVTLLLVRWEQDILMSSIMPLQVLNAHS